MNVYWFCQNKKVEDYLKKRKFKFISIYNPLKLIFISLKAQVVIDGGSNYFNFLNLIPGTSKKFTLVMVQQIKWYYINFIIQMMQIFILKNLII